MNIAIKPVAFVLGLSLLTACGGSNNGGGDGTTPPGKTPLAYFEEGIREIKKDYQPLRLNINSVREEQVKFSIGLPVSDGRYSHFMTSTLNKVFPNMIQQEWRSGNDHSIQIHTSQVSKELKLTIGDAGSNQAWEKTKNINVVKDSGYIVVTPQQADIEGTMPVTFVEGLDSTAPTGDYISFINRFSHATLGTHESDVCLVAMSTVGDAVYPLSSSLKQQEASKLKNVSQLKGVWRLGVVTRAQLNVQDVFEKPTDNQLHMIQAHCPDFTVGNGETLWQINPRVYRSSMTANIIFSPESGTIALTDTAISLKKLAWESE